MEFEVTDSAPRALGAFLELYIIALDRSTVIVSGDAAPVQKKEMCF